MLFEGDANLHVYVFVCEPGFKDTLLDEFGKTTPSSEDGRTEIMKLLFGETSIGKTMLMIAFGFVMGVFVYFLTKDNLTWHSMVGCVLAFDIGAGLLSNATSETNIAWQEKPKWLSVVFILFHLTVYPLVLLLTFKNFVYIGLFLIALLVIKTLLFANGVLFRPSDKNR